MKIMDSSPEIAVPPRTPPAPAAGAPRMPPSSWLFPLLAAVLYGVIEGLHLQFSISAAGFGFAVVLLAILLGAVFAAVHHAEIIAHRIGEPYGTLVLTLAVTVIEVTMIATMMLEGKVMPTVARDTVFAVMMIVCNGVVGCCILIGGLRFREQEFSVSGASAYLSVLTVLATITLVLPNYTFAAPGPVYSAAQLGFVSVATVMLYGVFLYIQTVRHRDYFVARLHPADAAGESAGGLAASVALLVLSLVAVVLLAKKFAGVVEAVNEALGAPAAFSGLVVATLILLPESVAAIGAARRNDLQKSINLGLGSSLATIGLTIPSVAVVSLVSHKTLDLGLEAQETVLLVLTFIVSMLTFGTGRTNVLFGLVHLVVFVLFVFLVFVP